MATCSAWGVVYGRHFGTIAGQSVWPGRKGWQNSTCNYAKPKSLSTSIYATNANIQRTTREPATHVIVNVVCSQTESYDSVTRERSTV